MGGDSVSRSSAARNRIQPRCGQPALPAGLCASVQSPARERHCAGQLVDRPVACRLPEQQRESPSHGTVAQAHDAQDG
jgi:hypothetical protein